MNMVVRFDHCEYKNLFLKKESHEEKVSPLWIRSTGCNSFVPAAKLLLLAPDLNRSTPSLPRGIVLEIGSAIFNQIVLFY